MFTIHNHSKELVFRMYQDLIKINNKNQTTQLENISKRLEHFTKENMYMSRLSINQQEDNITT